MSLTKSKELREKRAALCAEMSKLIPANGVEFTPEVREKFYKMDADQKVLKADIDSIESLEILETELRARGKGGPADSGNPDTKVDDKRTEEERDKEYRKLFWKGMRQGAFVKGAQTGGMETLRRKPEFDDHKGLFKKLDEYRQLQDAAA